MICSKLLKSNKSVELINYPAGNLLAHLNRYEYLVKELSHVGHTKKNQTH
jgi:hypothetical protein